MKISTVDPACKVQGCKVITDVRSDFAWSHLFVVIPDVRSTRLYGQFLVDKIADFTKGILLYMSSCCEHDIFQFRSSPPTDKRKHDMEI